MVNNNPLVRSVLTAWAFWYISLFLLAAGYFGVAPWRVLEYFVYACITMGAGSVIGISVVLAMQAATSHVTELGVRAGDRKREAIVNLGKLPSAQPATREKGAQAVLAAQPWWPRVEKAFPQHAAAIKAVVEVMLTEPRLPASPVPGGHGGRTLIEHSMAVAAEIMVQAKTWTYEGQRDKRGRIRVKAAAPHRFGGRDAGLLLLTGLAHDIGKVRCYQVVDSRPGRTVSVTERLPNHDSEGARLLRSIPEVMDLAYEDRTALLVAVGYYHHAYAIPLSGWITDRMRSLTELLVRADVETGRKEGHTLSHASYEGDFDDGDDVVEADARRFVDGETRAAVERAAEDPDEAVPLDDEADAQLRREILAARTARPAPSKPAQTPAPSAAAKPPAQHIPLEVKIAMAVLQKPGSINGRNKATRCAWKSGGRVYVLELAFRKLCQTHPDCPTEWIQDRMQEASGNMAPFTAAVLRYFASRNELLDRFDDLHLAPERALWVVKTPNGSELQVFILQTTAIPGATSVQDAAPMEIVRPFWGRHSARQSHASAAEPAAASSSLPAQQQDSMVATDFRRAATPSTEEAGLSAEDLPFDIPDTPTATDAPTSSEPAPSTGSGDTTGGKPTATGGAEVTSALASLIKDEELFPFPYETRERDGAQLAVIPLESEGGEKIGKLLAMLQHEGRNVSGVKTAKMAGTDHRAYVIPL